MTDFRWNEISPLFVIPFVVFGPLIVLGIYLQALAIVKQSKSFFGVFVKMASLAGLVGMSILVKQNLLPYLTIFVVGMVFSLIVASLARRNILS
jgi:hypothetical protein